MPMSTRYDADPLLDHFLGIVALEGARPAETRPLCYAVHFATSADLVRTDAPFESGRIRTRETPARAPGVAFLPGDAIMLGVAGEVWPIARDHFLLTYESAEAAGEPGRDGLFRKRARRVWVRRMDGPFAVRSRRGRLHGEAGDWLVEYAPGDMGIVGDAIFRATYRLLPPALPSALG